MEDSTGFERTCYLLLCGGRGAPQTQVFGTEDEARAEFRKASRAARVRTEWMELSIVTGGGRLQRIDSFARLS